MRVFINITAVLSFIVQFFPFIFSALNQKKPENAIDLLYHYTVSIAYLCSLLTIVIFFILYNFNIKILKSKWLNSVFLLIVILGTYIHISQLFVLKDFMFLSCILLVYDFFLLHKILFILIKDTTGTCA